MNSSNSENRDSGVADLGLLNSLPACNVKQDQKTTPKRSALTVT